MYLGYDEQGNIVRVGHDEQRLMGENLSTTHTIFSPNSKGRVAVDRSVAILKALDKRFSLLKIAGIVTFIAVLPDIIDFFKEIKNKARKEV